MLSLPPPQSSLKVTFPFHWLKTPIPTSPTSEVYCIHYSWSQSSATCPVPTSRSYGSHRICHHLRRTKSHTSCLRHQSSQHTFRFTCIPVQEAGRDLTFRMYSQYWYLPQASRQKKSYQQQFHTVHIQTYTQSPPGLISEELTWYVSCCFRPWAKADY